MREATLPRADVSRRPSVVRLVLHQAAHELRALVREPFALFFALVFPLLFFVLLSTLIGNQVIDARSGVRVAQFMAPAFASFGLVMATFASLAIGLTDAREDGILKRLRGTPLTPGAMVAARVLAGGAIGFLSVLLLEVVGIVFYDVQVIGRTLPASILTLVVAIACFSSLGIAVAAFAPTSQSAQAIANGLVIPLAFVSDIFAVGVTQLPAFMDAIGWFFPLRHLVNALGDATNPFLTGNGLYLDHLAVLAAWAVAGAVLAVRRLSFEPRSRTTGAESRRRATVPGRRAPRSGLAAIWGRELRHANSLLWRDPGSVFFAIGFPILLVLIVPQIYGVDVVVEGGTPLPRFYAPTMAVYGAAVTAYVNMPEGLARARERGVLTRLSGTPLPMAALLAGRIASTVWVALITLVGVLGLAGVLYGVPVPGTWPGVVITFVLTTICFAVLGTALVTLLPSARSVTAVALATLLPLSFVSDIFVVGAQFPAPLDWLGWASPLRHATNAVSAAYSVGATGFGLDLAHLAVIVGWLAAGAVVIAIRTRSGHLTGAAQR